MANVTCLEYTYGTCFSERNLSAKPSDGQRSQSATAVPTRTLIYAIISAASRISGCRPVAARAIRSNWSTLTDHLVPSGRG